MSKRKTYRGVNLPSNLVEQIERFIKKHPELGYTSITEFVKDAVRRMIEKP